MAQLPKPFKRPGIEISDGTKKSWRDVPVPLLEPGDMVIQRGMVSQVADYRDGYLVRFVSGDEIHYSEGDTVHAFVRV